MTMTPQHIENLTEIIQNRQSLFPKQFTGEVIEQDVIKWILYNAIQAPTHRKVNPWRFHVFSGDKKTEIGKFFQKTYQENLPQERFNENKFLSFPKKVNATSHLIVLTIVPNNERLVPEWENIAALSCAVQNMYLSITAAGLGGYWSSPSLMINHIKEFISLQPNEKCFGFFYIGVPKTEKPPIVDKGSIDDFTTWYD